MKTIQVKLVVAIVFIVSVAIVSMTGFIYWSFSQGFSAYKLNQELDSAANLKVALADYYQKHQSWAGFLTDDYLWRDFHDDYLEPRSRRRHSAPPPPPRKKSTSIRHRLAILDEHKELVIGNDKVTLNNSRSVSQPIKVDQKIVGYLALQASPLDINQNDVGFIQSQIHKLLLIAVSVFILSLVIIIFVAQRITKPVKQLLSFMKKLNNGDYGHTIEVISEDELGKLTENANGLSQTLLINEESRKAWISDISHELRTPLSVTKSQLEAMQDGIRPLNQESLMRLAKQLLRLNHLVDDLYQLSLYDSGGLSYKKEPVYVHEIINDVLEDYTDKLEQKGIEVQYSCSNSASMNADYDRLIQLFTNLITNTIRYTDSPGKLDVKIRSKSNNSIYIQWQDSSPSVDRDHLDKLFDRLYRPDKSRNRESGGAGIGLSLSKSIVEAHGGSISVEISKLGGLLFNIELKNDE